MDSNILATNQLVGTQAELLSKLKKNHVDLASERVGGETLQCSDDFFAGMENLIKSGRGIFIEDKYTDRGKWMDGWESKRSYGRTNDSGQPHQYDWCIIRLGIEGKIKGFDIDTNYFRGNAPQFVSVEACHSLTQPGESADWKVILDKSEVQPHFQNIFEIDNLSSWTHVRLKMYPDGGIARFRVYGDADINWNNFVDGELIDLAAITNGAKALLVSDMFFSDKNNLIMPGRGKNMGDGWETKRRRDPGPDWSVVQLATKGSIEKVIIDTCHFKGNFPDSFLLEGAVSHADEIPTDWKTILPKTKLFAHREHLFIKELVVDQQQIFTRVRLSIFPDGGISRMRVFGRRERP
jgi:allantoicase